MNRPEQNLQKCVVDWLSLIKPPCVWFAVPNGGYRSAIEAAIFKGLGVKPGVSDLVFLWGRGAGCVELKSGTGKQTDLQKEFEYWCSQNGVNYSLARSLEDVRNCLVDWGLLESNLI